MYFMTPEMLAILIASTLPLAIAVAGFVILGTILRRMGGKMDADDRRRVEEILREMRETLRN
jgi:hypothetical protein